MCISVAVLAASSKVNNDVVFTAFDIGNNVLYQSRKIYEKSSGRYYGYQLNIYC